MSRDLDIVVFGATGDCGLVGCCHLFFTGKKLGISSWAPAARNLVKLKRDVLDPLKDAQKDGVLPPSEPIQADSGDYASLLSMCKRAKCVIACAGPFAQYGEGIVRACAETGTHYVDITGEVPWVEKMERRYGAQAEKSGACLVSCAGYDSTPPDLCTYLAAKTLEKAGDKLECFDAFCGFDGGSLPTGTINTVLDGVDDAKSQALKAVTFGLLGGKKKKEKHDTQEKVPEDRSRSFVPASEQSALQSNLLWSMCPGYSSLGGQFCLGHFMAPINVHTVHHTAAKEGYGGLVYRERMGGLPRGALSLYGLLPTAVGAIGTPLLLLPLAIPGVTTLVRKWNNRADASRNDYSRKAFLAGSSGGGKTFVHGYGISQQGRCVNVKMKCDYDAGLGYTMASATAVASQLVLNRGKSTPGVKPGFNSAVVAVGGDELVKALSTFGVTFNIEPPSSSKL